MRFFVECAFPHLGKRGATSRKSAFCYLRLTEKRTLKPTSHGKPHSATPRSRGLRLSVTSRRPGGVGQPPARLRGTMENASTGQMRSSNHPPACGAGCARVRRSLFGVRPHGKAHSGLIVSRKDALCDPQIAQTAPFRHAAAPGRCGATPRQAAGHYGECLNWANALAQPPASLRGGLCQGPQVSVRSLASRKGALCPTGGLQNALFRHDATAECVFP